MISRIQTIVSNISHGLKVSLPLAFTIEILSNLQINDILLDKIFDNVYTDQSILLKLGTYLSSLFGSFGLFDSLNPDAIFLKATWILVVCYLLLHVFLLIVLCLISTKSKNNLFVLMLKGTSFVSLLHSRIIFFIIQYFFMKLISLYNSCNLSADDSFPCNDVWYGLTILFCVINCSLALLKETVLYEINPNKRNSYAVKNNLFHKMVVLHKLVATTIFFLMEDSDSAPLVNPLISLLFIGMNLIILFVKLPFYNIALFKASIITEGVTLSISIVSLLEGAKVEQTLLVILCFLIPPLLVKSLLILNHQLCQHIMQGNLNSPERAIHFVMLLKKNKFGYISPSLYPGLPHPDALMSNGILVQQNADVGKISITKDKKEHQKKIYTHLVERLMQILDKNPNSELLLLFIAHICLNKLENIPKAIILVRRVESLSLSFSVRNSVDKFNLKLQEIHRVDYVQANDDKLNLLEYFKERRISNSIKEKMQNEVRRHLEFWEELRKDKVDVQKIIDISCFIEKTSSQIEDEWKSLKGFTKHYLNPMVMYGTYLDIVKEHTDDARNLLKRFWSLANDPHQDQILDVCSDKAAVVVISLEKTNLGAILDASASTQTLFEIEKQDFIGLSLASLLPPVVGETILKFLELYIRKPAEKLDYSLQSYAKASTGEYFEMKIELKLFPEVGRQVKAMVTFEKVSQGKAMLVVNNEGTIVECSESLKQTFYNKKVGDHHAVILQQFAPEFEKVNSAFNQVYGLNVDLNDTSSKLSVTSRADTQPRNLFYKRRQSLKPSQDSSKKIRKVNEPPRLEGPERELTQHEQASPLVNLSYEDYKKICEEFSQGSKIKIMIDNFETKYEMDYDVQIFPLKAGSEVYKILSLSNSQEKTTIIQGFMNEIEPSVIDSNFAADFPDANERLEDQPKTSLLKVSQIVYKPASVDDNWQLTAQSQDRDTDEIPKRDHRLKHSNSLLKGHKQDTSNETPGQRARVNQNPENSVSTTSSRTIASVKALRRLFDKKQYYVLGRRTSLSLFTIMTFIIAFVLVGYFVSTSASDQIEAGVNIINYANVRLSSALRGWQLATRVFQLYRGLRTLNLVTTKNNLYVRALSMLDQNNKLLTTFSQIDEDLVREIITEEIKIHELYENGSVSVVKVNTFLATDILANKMLVLANTTDSLIQDKMLREVQYLSNNTCNDYFVYSENFIITTQKILEKLITSNITNLQLILSFELAGLVSICLSLLIAARIVSQSYKRLFKALTKIDEKNVIHRLHQLQKMKQVLIEDLDTKRFSEGTSSVLRSYKKDHGKDKGKNVKKTFQKIEDRILTKKMFIYIARHLTLSLIVTQTVTILCVTALLGTIASFKSLEDVNHQLSVTTKSGYQTSAIISTFNAEMVWANETTMLVRNQNKRDQLVKFYESITNVNVDLISVFSGDGEGISDPFIQQLFESNLCGYLSASALTSCNTATTSGAIGILGINSKLLALAGTYIRVYLSNPTFSNIRTFIDSYATIMRPSADTLEEAYQLINGYILRVLSQDLERFATKNLALHLGIVTAVLLSTLFVYKGLNFFDFLKNKRRILLIFLLFIVSPMVKVLAIRATGGD